MTSTTLDGSSIVPPWHVCNHELHSHGLSKEDATRCFIPDMDRVSAEELLMISAAEREQAYDELHGVFTKNSEPAVTDGVNTSSCFEETPELIESSVVLLRLELERIPPHRKRTYLKAVFLKPTLESDTQFQLMFLRADRFHVQLAAQRICRFFDEKEKLFGEKKLLHRLTLDDLSDDDIASICGNGAGQLMPHKDRSGRLVFFADYFFLEFKDYKNVNRMVWYLAMAAVEHDEDVQKKGVVEVFFANDALGKRIGITEHLTKGLSALLCLPIRFVGIHFCYDSAIFKPIVQLAQMAFGAGNRLRFRSHFGSALEIQYELLSYGIVIPMELFDRDTIFKASLSAAYLSKRRDMETEVVDKSGNGLVDHPDPEDILLGKGRACQEYSGNRAMNRMIDERAGDYRLADKGTKTSIAVEIVDHMQTRGRFLERIDGSGWKVVLDEATLRKKITQAFRVRNRLLPPAAANASEETGNLSSKRFRNN